MKLYLRKQLAAIPTVVQTEERRRVLKYCRVHLGRDNPQKASTALHRVGRKLQYARSQAFFRKHCLLTNKGKVAVKRFRVARMQLKEFLDWGIIPGYRKASW